MRTAKRFAFFCIMCLLCQPILAQRRVRLADLPPFERAVVVVKYFEGLHRESCLLYTSDAADDGESVDLGGRRIIKKKRFTATNYTTFINC